MKSGQNKFLQIFCADDTQFQEIVPNFPHSLDTLKLGMK
jgi:hypothetical protein